MTYEQKQKMLNVFKERLKAGNDKLRIRDHQVSMNQNDYLVFYEYTYRYSENKKPKCTTNERTIIKGFPIASIEGIQEKLAKKLAGNWNKDKYISHKIIAIKQPFVSKEGNYLNRFKQYLREKSPKGKPVQPKKAAGIGVRG
jgi:hypothetical protein